MHLLGRVTGIRLEFSSCTTSEATTSAPTSTASSASSVASSARTGRANQLGKCNRHYSCKAAVSTYLVVFPQSGRRVGRTAYGLAACCLVGSCSARRTFCIFACQFAFVRQHLYTFTIRTFPYIILHRFEAYFCQVLRSKVSRFCCIRNQFHCRLAVRTRYRTLSYSFARGPII